jgi:site-specific recombinase XerD
MRMHRGVGMREWDQLVENHLRVCTTRGLAECVVLARRRELDRWGNWLKRKRPKPKVSEIGAELILEYIRGRTAFHSKATVAGLMSQMRNMGEFLVQEGVWEQNPLRWIRSPKLDPRRILPRRIKKDELSKLFECAAKIQDPHRRSRSLVILVLLYSTGMRRGELARLSLSDWNAKECSIRINSQKVNLERILPVPSVVARYIEEYLPIRQNRLLQEGTNDQEAFFVGQFGRRLRGDDISNIIRRLSKAADIPLVTLHQFRHSCASDLLEEGVGVPEVQRVLGHATLVTTTRYTHIADPYRRKAVSLHPINSILNSPTPTPAQGESYADVG